MTRLIAHRGFAGEYPENTLAAFDAAVGRAAMIELDVRRCESGELVVFHDERLDRMTDRTGRLAETDYESLRACEVLGSGAGVPTLADAVGSIPDAVGINIELKERGLAEEVVAIAAALDNEVVISSFDARTLESVRAVTDDLPVAYLVADDDVSGLTTALALDCEYIHPHYTLCLYTDLIDRAHEHGVGVNAWTVTETDVAAQLSDAGVDGLIADYSDVL